MDYTVGGYVKFQKWSEIKQIVNEWLVILCMGALNGTVLVGLMGKK